MMAWNDWDGIQGDIVTAFLHGELADEIYMKPPAGIHPQSGEDFVAKDGRRAFFNDDIQPSHFVWKLKKSIYGLRQSRRCFYTKLDNVLTSKGYSRIRTDYGVWRKLDVILIVVTGAPHQYPDQRYCLKDGRYSIPITILSP